MKWAIAVSGTKENDYEEFHVPLKKQMKIIIIFFGQIADITGNSTLIFTNVADTNEMIQQLHTRYPALANTKYAIAVDKKIINENMLLSSNHTVALLPPFSGG